MEYHNHSDLSNTFFQFLYFFGKCIDYRSTILHPCSPDLSNEVYKREYEHYPIYVNYLQNENMFLVNEGAHNQTNMNWQFKGIYLIKLSDSFN